jgi:hypothetical protein
MRIYNYKFSTDVHPDVAYMISNALESSFTETKLSLQVHAYSEYDYFFIADQEDQDKMISLINSVVDLFKTDDVNDIYYSKIVDEIKDVTDVVLNDIDKYDDLANLYGSLKNVVLNFYYNSNNQNTILDKVIEKGVGSLGKHDKIILDGSVK